MNENIRELNIQPEAGILKVFSRLSYKPWYAIAEFVDNSTASYFGHKQIFKFYKIKKMTVSINYDSYKNELTIEDNAFGMNYNDFQRAVLLDSKPDNLNGRNEFGMGLKTAASWFGNIWTVESTQLGSANKYFTEVNINKLRDEKLNTINIHISQTDVNEHYTKITIKEITKKISPPNTKRKIKEILSSMYRRDIKNGEVEIYFNGEKLQYSEGKILTFRNITWRKNINFSFIFDNKKYNVDGFVGILEKGGYDKTGFSLFRNNRVIKGNGEECYKPLTIYQQLQSQISLKLFGELNMDDFPVNQAKDGFVWDDGLEDEFLKHLKIEIKDYIDIAKLSIKERTSEEQISDDHSENTKNEVEATFKDLILESQNDDHVKKESEQTDIVSIFEKEQEEVSQSLEAETSSVREYDINLDLVTKKHFKVCWKIDNDLKWIDYTKESGEITINLNHPFFKPFTFDDNFKILLEKFVVSFICAEELAILACKPLDKEGYILPSVFREKMNNILKIISKKRGN